MIFNFCHVSLSVRGGRETKSESHAQTELLYRAGKQQGEAVAEAEAGEGLELRLQFTKAAQNRTMMRGINSSSLIVAAAAAVAVG